SGLHGATLARRPGRLAPRSSPAARPAGGRRLGGRRAGPGGHPRDRAFRVPHHPELRAHPPTGVRAVPFPHGSGPHGPGNGTPASSRRPPDGASRRPGGQRTPARPAPPAAPRSSDALLAVAVQNPPSPSPRAVGPDHSHPP